MASNTSSKVKTQLRYRYILLATTFVIMVMVYGGLYSFGVFFKPMINEFGWSRASTSGPFSIFALVTGLMGILAGRISDKIGCRWVISVGSILVGAGYIATSRITGLWQFYILYGLIIATGVSAMYVPFVSLITRWFPHRPGIMLGISIAGIGFGIGTGPLIANKIVINYGWRDTMFVLGAVSLAVIIVLAQIIRQPEATPKNHKNIPIPFKLELSFSDALRTQQFWMLFLAWFCYGFFYQLALVHIVPYATDIGMSATSAALIMTTIGLVGTPARVILGILGDKFGNRRTIITSFLLIALAYLGLILVNSIWMIYVFGVIFGAFSGIGILLASIAGEHFGMRSLGAIVGAIFFANSIGSAVSPFLAGSIYDLAGNYFLAFLLCTIFGIAASIILWRLHPINRNGGKLAKQQE